MAVVRENTQFRIGKIGVSRASQAASIESESIQRNLSSLGTLAFEKAKAYAIEVGEDAGNVATVIDPATGLPTALIPPKGLGSIASEAYQRVSETRFRAAVENEIKVKGFELSERYKNNRNGAAQYSQAMQTYVKSMESAAEGPGYKSYIRDRGDAYHDGTFASMTAAQADRERAEARIAAEQLRIDGLQALEMQASITGANSEEVKVMSSQVKTGVNNSHNAGFENKRYVTQHQKDDALAIARGELRRLITPKASTEDLTLIKAAISSQNPSLLPDGYESIARLMSAFGNDLSSLLKMESFADEFIVDVAPAAALREQELEDLINVGLAEQTSAIVLGTDLSVGSGKQAAILVASKDNDFNLSEVVSQQITSAALEVFRINNLVVEGMSGTGDGNSGLKLQLAEAEKGMLSKNLNEFADGLITNMVSGDVQLKTTDIQTILTALKANKIDYVDLAEELSPEVFQYVRNLKKLTDREIDLDGTVNKNIINRLTSIQTAGDILMSKTVVLSPAERSSIEGKAFADAIDVTFKNLMDEIKVDQANVSDLRSQNLNESADEKQNAINEKIVAYADGLIRRSTIGLDAKDVVAYRAAAEDKDPNKAPTNSSREAIAYLKELENIYPISGDSTIWTKIDSHISNYGLGGAKSEEAKRLELKKVYAQGASFTLSKMRSGIVDLANTVNPNDVAGKFAEQAAIINGIKYLDKNEKEGAFAELRAASSKAMFNSFIGTNPDEAQLRTALPFFNGVADSGSLTEEQVALLGEARVYAKGANDSEDVSTSLTTSFGRGITLAEKNLQDLREEQEFFSDVQSLVRGIAGENSVEVMDQLIKNKGIDPYLLVSDPEFLSTEKGRQLVNTMQASQTLPTAIASTFSRIADGGFANMQGLDLPLTLRLYEDLKTSEFAGQTVDSPIVTNMDAEERATLDFMVLATGTFGSTPESIAEAFTSGNNLQNKEFVNGLKSKYGIDEDEDLTTMAREISRYNMLSPTDQQTLQVMTQTFMIRSQQNGINLSKKEILAYGNQWVSDNRPMQSLRVRRPGQKEGHIVFDPDARLSESNLNITVPGNEELFYYYSRGVAMAAIVGTELEGKLEFGPTFRIERSGLYPDRENTISLRPSGYTSEGSAIYQIMYHDEMGTLKPIPPKIVEQADGRNTSYVDQSYISTKDFRFLQIVKGKKMLDVLTSKNARNLMLSSEASNVSGSSLGEGSGRRVRRPGETQQEFIIRTGLFEGRSGN